jgi:hypothetical protein
MFSSDVGHFDVIDMSEVLEEAYELGEDAVIKHVLQATPIAPAVEAGD